MSEQYLSYIQSTLNEIEHAGLWKREREIVSAQSGIISVVTKEMRRDGVINLCANNYLGLANHPALISAATAAMKEYGFGMSSVRFICGTQDLHRQLEKRIAEFLFKDDAILFAFA